MYFFAAGLAKHSSKQKGKQGFFCVYHRYVSLSERTCARAAACSFFSLAWLKAIPPVSHVVYTTLSHMHTRKSCRACTVCRKHTIKSIYINWSSKRAVLFSINALEKHFFLIRSQSCETVNLYDLARIVYSAVYVASRGWVVGRCGFSLLSHRHDFSLLTIAAASTATQMIIIHWRNESSL